MKNGDWFTPLAASLLTFVLLLALQYLASFHVEVASLEVVVAVPLSNGYFQNSSRRKEEKIVTVTVIMPPGTCVTG